MKGTNISIFFSIISFFLTICCFFEGDVFVCVFFDLVEEYGLFLTIKIGRDERMFIAAEKKFHTVMRF